MSSITQAGSQLMAQALSFNRIVFMGAWLVETLYSDGELSSMTTLNPGGNDIFGAVKRVMYSEGQCLATAEFQNSQSGTYQTAIIMAKLESQSDGEAVPFCGFNDSGIYSPSGVQAFIDVDFTLTFIRDESIVQIIEGDAATPEYVDALRADVFNHGGLCRVYGDFLKAQCYAADGESACIDPHGPDVMYIGNRPYRGPSSTTKHGIADVCDHIMAVLLTDSSKTYINCFDLRDARFENGKLYLQQPFVCASLGDENSAKGRIKIAKIGGHYFAFAYTDSSSTNLWWYNQYAGQDQSTKVVGRCAVMALEDCTVPTSGGGTQALIKGHWYYVADSTTAAVRSMGKDLAIYTSAVADDSSTLSLVRLSLSYHESNSRAILFAAPSPMYGFGTGLIDSILTNGAQTYVELCEATKMSDGIELVLMSKCDMSVGLARTGAGCMIRDGSTIQSISVNAQINASFWSGYNLEANTITAITAGMYIEGSYDYERIYKTCAGLWIDAGSNWVKCESALQTALVYNSEGCYDSHQANTVFLNGHILQTVPSGATTRLIWGVKEHLVCTSLSELVGAMAMLPGDNVCTGIGLIGSWMQAYSDNDLWLMYVPPKQSVDAGWPSCVKVDGKI
ncbi:MAG: hypothetical protein IJ165_00255 [Proteobacteria bacterium]|nr:hypothetical protein [Pseudomonadota bacterium]